MNTFKSFIDSDSRPKIYCDMDGVLADFHGAISRLYGEHDPTTELSDDIKADLTRNHHDIFATLEWMKGGQELWNHIGKHKPNILSASPIGWLPWAGVDKKVWIRKHLRPAPVDIIIGKRSDKQKHATTNGKPNILIDDYKRNIKEWIAAGGIGIHHKDTANTINQLKTHGY